MRKIPSTAWSRGGDARMVNPVFATIGDSQVSNNVVNAATLKQLPPTSAVVMAMRLSRQKVAYPLANQLGVGGTTISAIKATAASAVATGAKFVVFCGGTNDGESGSAGLAARQQDAVDAFAAILKGGANVIVIPLIRRTDGGKTANTDAFCDGFNAWLYAGGVLGVSTAASNTGQMTVRAVTIAQATRLPPSLGTRVIVCDFSSLVNSGTQEPLTDTLQSDGLHHNGNPAYVAGLQIKNLLDAYPSRPNNTRLTGVSVWGAQATDHGLLVGTGGSALVQSGFTGSGDVATGWQLNYSGGTATFTGVCSKIASMYDKSADRGQRVVVASSVAGSADERINLQCSTNLTAGLAVGDRVYMEGFVNIASPANFRGVQLQFSEVGPGAPQQSAEAYLSNSVTASALSGVWRTPVITLQSGITALSTSLSYGFRGNNGAFGATIDVSDLRIMKV